MFPLKFVLPVARIMWMQEQVSGFLRLQKPLCMKASRWMCDAIKSHNGFKDLLSKSLLSEMKGMFAELLYDIITNKK
jgi:hypothetical protein